MRDRDHEPSLTAQLAAFFKAHPDEAIDATRLEELGGRQAWRTRVSNCRLIYGMQIDNIQRRWPSGRTRSMYRYVPPRAPARAPTQLTLIDVVK
jgi:hypothetical protein